MDVIRNKLISYNKVFKKIIDGRLPAISSYLSMNNVKSAVREKEILLEKIGPGLAKPSSKSDFALSKIVIEPSHESATNEIKTFLFSQCLKQQPTIAFLARPPSNNYIKSLIDKYSTTGDRWLAYQIDSRRQMRHLVGTVVTFKKFPWESAWLEQTAHQTPDYERYHMYFQAYCARSADVFSKYRIPYVCDIELIVTANMAAEHRMEDALLSTVLCHVVESGHYPLVQVLATTNPVREACARAGMMLEWSTPLADVLDENGHKVFCSGNELLDQTASADLFVRLFRPETQTSRPFKTKSFFQKQNTIQAKKNYCPLQNFFLSKSC